MHCRGRIFQYCLLSLASHGKTEYTEISRKKHHGADENITEFGKIDFCGVFVCSVMFFSVKFPCTPFFRGRLINPKQCFTHNRMYNQIRIFPVKSFLCSDSLYNTLWQEAE
ncbi:hypothetical protein McpAg1_00350 [Methanocorpusculaceae archaeon Ag1]|uniref:Uncharacterized protein n=1 Tax=Methanorbis furvi TaxID=3028299 RepID=A0AAE4MBW9_9EURY|nr:hypothetical protein [Methanocorpusculaceae archaeon Ag1]